MFVLSENQRANNYDFYQEKSTERNSRIQLKKLQQESKVFGNKLQIEEEAT